MIDLKIAKAVCDASSPGPWHWLNHQVSDEDAAFIAFSRTFIPKAIREIQELRELLFHGINKNEP